MNKEELVSLCMYRHQRIALAEQHQRRRWRRRCTTGSNSERFLDDMQRRNLSPALCHTVVTIPWLGLPVSFRLQQTVLF